MIDMNIKKLLLQFSILIEPNNFICSYDFNSIWLRPHQANPFLLITSLLEGDQVVIIVFVLFCFIQISLFVKFVFRYFDI